MSLQHLLLILRARWRIVVATMLIIVIATASINLALPKQYRSVSTVVVDVKGSDPVSGGNSQQNQAVPGYLATQVGIVGSERVIKRVIDSLGLAQDKHLKDLWRTESAGQMPFDDWLRARLLKKLDVSPSHEGNLIDISVSWDESKRSAQIANAFAQAYIDTNLELKVEPAKQYASWFEDRTRALRVSLEEARKRLSDYERQNGIVAATDARMDVESARLSELSSQLTALQGLRADSASRERQTGGNRNNLAEVLQNPVIAGLKSDLSKLEGKRADMSVRLGDNHPELQRLDGEIASLRQRVSLETNRIAASLSTNNRINQQRESEIRSELDAQRNRVLQLGRQRDQISALQNDVANAQRAYDTVTQRLAQTSLESQNQTTNVMIITPAVASIFPDSPRIKVNLALALIFGALAGLALALLTERIDQRVHGQDHLRAVLGVPVFGELDHTPRVSTRFTRRLGMARRPAIA